MSRAALVLLALALCPAVARADGWLAMRGAYYKERSTRVVQPMVDAELETSPHGLLKVHFLVDQITSASPAAGTPQEFSETRYEGGFDYTRTIDNLRVGGGGRYSTEDDYDSIFGSAHLDLELAQKNTLLRFSVAGGHDTITNGVQVAMGEIGTPRIVETLNTYLLSASVSQVLGPQLVGTLTYDVIFLDGYQANIYRRVTGAETPVPERVPDSRVRNAVFGALRGYVCPSKTTLFAGYRLYADDWGIVGHTPEARVIQEIVRGLDLRLRFRWHVQSGADFYQDVYTAADIMNDPYVTEDEKLSEMQTRTVGGQLSVELALLGVKGAWGEARLDALVEYVDQTTAFRDAWIGEIGLRVPLTY